MSERDLRRVAVLQYGWPLQSHTISLALHLAAAGVEVDLFLKDCPSGLVDLAAIGARSGIALHDLSLPAGVRMFARSRAVRFGWSVIERIDQRLRYRGVSGAAVREALLLVGDRAHDLYIGVEKLGLIWAGQLSGRTGVPFAYYSLELYGDDHPQLNRIPGYSRVRALEKHFHARASATIVQDEARGAWLLGSNGLPRGELIFLPVSVAGPALRTRGNYLQERHGLRPGLPVLLYLGAFEEERGCIGIAEVARSQGDRLAMVFHGYGDAKLVRRLREASGGKAIVSTELVEPARLAELVSSADIGLAFYRSDLANDRLTAFASEKLALYCQTGVPFIARDDGNYQDLLAQFRCGELVADPAGIPAAAGKILGDREAYRENAYCAFEMRYRFETHAGRLIARLAQLQQRRTGSNPSRMSNTPST